MGFRFRKSIRLAPGVRLNLARRGASLSLGVAGAMLNLGRRGARGTVGLPGSGLSYTTRLFGGGTRSAPRNGSSAPPAGCGAAPGWVLLACVGLCLLAAVFAWSQRPAVPQSMLSTPPAATPPPTDRAGETIAPALHHVRVDRLNCRTAPDKAAPVRAQLRRGEEAMAVARAGGWLRLARSEGDCWASEAVLAVGALARPSASEAAYTPPRSYAGDGCPCSGSSVCTGRRGGRYCITSGGRKRYGV